MKNGIVIIILIIIAGLAVYIFTTNETEGPNPSQEMENLEEEMMVEDDVNPEVAEENQPVEDDRVDSNEDNTASGTYEDYDESKLAMTAEGDIVLFFHANWCPTCRSLDSDIAENQSNIPEGVTILKVDYDSNPDLRQKYEVTFQHTLVQIESNGEMLKKWTGSPTLDRLLGEVS